MALITAPLLRSALANSCGSFPQDISAAGHDEKTDSQAQSTGFEPKQNQKRSFEDTECDKEDVAVAVAVVVGESTIISTTTSTDISPEGSTLSMEEGEEGSQSQSAPEGNRRKRARGDAETSTANTERKIKAEQELDVASTSENVTQSETGTGTEREGSLLHSGKLEETLQWIREVVARNVCVLSKEEQVLLGTAHNKVTAAALFASLSVCLCLFERSLCVFLSVSISLLLFLCFSLSFVSFCVSVCLSA